MRPIFSPALIKTLQDSSVFVVGCGAIGCELLKNFAMMGLATGEGARLTVTDPDHIEYSNLNRQFLFREKHLRMPKSIVAAASITQMNPNYKRSVDAHTLKVCPETEDKFDDGFMRRNRAIANALDNVQARIYVDGRCIKNRVPLLESGTLGPKGHVQVIYPGQTESYGSKADPSESAEIPHCTLKMFPEETLHCIEWARDLFGSTFSLKPKAVGKLLEEAGRAVRDAGDWGRLEAAQRVGALRELGLDVRSLNESLHILQSIPQNFMDSLAQGCTKFHRHFVRDIASLLRTYPPHCTTKDGKPFWRLPKRMPRPMPRLQDVLDGRLDHQGLPRYSELAATFVVSYAVLLSRAFRVPFPPHFRKSALPILRNFLADHPHPHSLEWDTPPLKPTPT